MKDEIQFGKYQCENGLDDSDNQQSTDEWMELTAWTEDDCHGECEKCSNNDCGSR